MVRTDRVSRYTISIHTLRMEGDAFDALRALMTWAFQSTPSAWRVTANSHNKSYSLNSIFIKLQLI